MATRFKAMLNDFALDLETIQDTIEKSVAVHEYPFSNGAKTEDLGENARRIRFRAHWFGATYDLHFEVRNELRRLDFFQLIHPVYGSLVGRITSVAVNHGDEPDHVTIDFDFVEDLLNQVDVARKLNVAQAIEEAFVNGQSKQIESYTAILRKDLGTEAGAILAQTINEDESIITQLSGLSANARDYVYKIDRALAACEATLTSIEQPADSIIATINFGLNLPGRVVGSMAKMVERYAVMVQSLEQSPSKFLDALKFNLEKLEDSFADLLSQLRLSGAQRLALEAAKVFDADELNRREYRKQETRAIFDPNGKFIPGPVIDGIITVPEAEVAIQNVRSYLQTALDGNREMETLRDMARDLIIHVSQIKFEYEKVRELEIDSSLPVHLLCLKAGLPYSAATRVLSLNPNVIKPSFMQGAVKVYAR